jgi:hypothetical protein
MDTRYSNRGYPPAAFRRMSAHSLPADGVDLYFELYARAVEEKPPFEAVRLNALPRKPLTAAPRYQHGLGQTIARFLGDNRVVRWLVSKREKRR